MGLDGWVGEQTLQGEVSRWCWGRPRDHVGKRDSSSSLLGDRSWSVDVPLWVTGHSARAGWGYRAPSSAFQQLSDLGQVTPHPSFGFLTCRRMRTIIPASQTLEEILYPRDPAGPAPSVCTPFPPLAFLVTKTEWDQASPNNRVLRVWLPGAGEVAGPGADLEEAAGGWHEPPHPPGPR